MSDTPPTIGITSNISGPYLESGLSLKEGCLLVFCRHLNDSRNSPIPISIGQIVEFKEITPCEGGNRIRLEGFISNGGLGNWNFVIECFSLHTEGVYHTSINNQTKTEENGKQNNGKVIEVQRITPSIGRKETRRGCPISGQGSKVAIRIRHRSYREAVSY